MTSPPTVKFLDLERLHRDISAELEQACSTVIRSGHYIMGPELEAFELEFAQYCGVDHCLGVANGLDALRLLLMAYGIGPGDEVLVPSNTFIATWLAVSQCGATPVGVEPSSGLFNMCPSELAQKITPRTRAIIPVHLYGQTAEMDAIMAVANQHGLIVIEDAAQSQGATYHGRRSGSLGHAAATSFYPGKNLGALGDAGAVLTSDAHIAARVRMLRNYGSAVKYQHDWVGLNSRLDEIPACGRFLRHPHFKPLRGTPANPGSYAFGVAFVCRSHPPPRCVIGFFGSRGGSLPDSLPHPTAPPKVLSRVCWRAFPHG